ncbi:MAG: tRNA (adenosine(37)-N6)-threonylcarbamoyltransferase complex dimerization subunit type 1 TsaB [Deltaproteobacteria bacterium]|nr:tRNA (adenosine(37)-N6)-threonylcarbamoyltransferase complex dimerization subunit type 1 TsaB [Deltaproteobacteria bacterium]
MDRIQQLFLCIDSSTPAGSVALVREGSVIAEHLLQVKKRSHSDYLMKYVHELLEEADMSLSDLSGLVVVNGPGSFTGLRVGLATVQGISQALSLPIYPVSSLQVIAYANGPSDLPVVALIDARKQEVYTACYEWTKGIPVLQGAEQVIAPKELLKSIRQRSYFVGNGATLYRALIDETISDQALLSTAVNDVPRASAAGLLITAMGDSAVVVEARSLQPSYVRLSDAELQKKG